jgi:hypothetical protein
MGKKSQDNFMAWNCSFIFSPAILVRIRLMLHETKWFCRLVLFAVQVGKKHLFCRLQSFILGLKSATSLKENWQIELLNYR